MNELGSVPSSCVFLEEWEVFLITKLIDLVENCRQSVKSVKCFLLAVYDRVREEKIRS